VVVAAALTGWKTGSVSAALVLAPILVAAWLVLLLPLVVGCVGLAGKLEEFWRSAHDPEFRGWLNYRRALSEYEAELDRRPSVERQLRWLNADSDQLRDGVVKLFGASGSCEVLDRQGTGADLLVDDGNRRTVIRCEAGSAPAAASAARELVMAQLDLKADDAVLVAPAGASPSLLRFVASHPMRMLDAEALEIMEYDSSRPFG